MSKEDNPRYVRKRLREMAIKAREDSIFPESNKISSQCENAAAVLIQFVYLAAETGDFSYEYDVSSFNRASISKICEIARKELGDVYLVISMGGVKRTIRAEWGH